MKGLGAGVFVLASLALASCSSQPTTPTSTATITVTASAGPGLSSPFNRMWRNVDPDTGGIRHILLHREPDRLSVRAWGACVPVDCAWGALSVLGDQLSGSTLNLLWNHGFATSSQTLTLIDDRLQVTEHRHYVDSSGRED